MITEVSAQAISAAVFAIVQMNADADSFVITRAITEAKGADKICAFVWGRGVKLRKATRPGEAVTPSKSEANESE